MPKRKKSKSKVTDRYRGVVSDALQSLVARLLLSLSFTEVTDLLQHTIVDLDEDDETETPGVSQESTDCAGVLIEGLLDAIDEVAGDA